MKNESEANMISLTTLIIAGGLFLAALLAGIFFPHPMIWLCTLILGGILFFVLLPKYQGQQQAAGYGVEIQAAVQEVREWSRKTGDGDYIDRYEIIAVAPNPDNGRIHTFVSPPMSRNPKPYLKDSITVKVDWSNPEAYVMDLSFLPFDVH